MSIIKTMAVLINLQQNNTQMMNNLINMCIMRRMSNFCCLLIPFTRIKFSKYNQRLN